MGASRERGATQASPPPLDFFKEPKFEKSTVSVQKV
jgi:hypothetical protein